jgi:alpha-tubulin suppressor-like RCC1 family protein
MSRPLSMRAHHPILRPDAKCYQQPMSPRALFVGLAWLASAACFRVPPYTWSVECTKATPEGCDGGGAKESTDSGVPAVSVSPGSPSNSTGSVFGTATESVGTISVSHTASTDDAGLSSLNGDSGAASPDLSAGFTTSSALVSATGSTAASTGASATSSVLIPASAVCGDGTSSAGEVCDDGNKVTETTCSYGQATCTACNATCSATLNLTGPTCGDGVISNGELCDVNLPGCQACKIVPAVTAGYYHSCALLSNGSVKCWGSNDSGQLGNVESGVDRAAPVSVSNLSGVVSVTAGSYHSCALLNNGSVKCWGNNYSGQLGNGTSGDGTNQSSPVDVGNLSGVVAATAGDNHNCVLLSNGSVKCWGNNEYGQLGNGDSGSGKHEFRPVTVSNLSGVIAVAAQGAHTCAVLNDGAVKCWGNNRDGELGNGESGPGNHQSLPVAVSNLNGVLALGLGGFHTCALLGNSNVKCWGLNYTGQLGSGESGVGADRSSPVGVTNLSGAVAVTAGRAHTCAQLSSGNVKCWGANSDTQIGNGQSTDVTSPMAVSNLANVLSVAAGSYHTCAQLSAGGVKCWGNNTHGQLGNGGTDNKSTPVEVLGLP